MVGLLAQRSAFHHLKGLPLLEVALLTVASMTHKPKNMGLLRHRVLEQPRRMLRSLYSALPFGVAVRLARGKPDWAFYIGDRSRRVTIRDYLDSLSVTIDTSADIQRRMLSRTYDTEVLDVVQRFVPRGGTCVDVGANVGAHTLAMALRTGDSGVVHAVEPGPAFLERLRENLHLNPQLAARVVIHDFGLSDHEGTAQWQDSAHDPGTATMHWVDPKRQSRAVSITTLDRLARDFSRLDLIKIDVDGMDHIVLRGAAETIARHLPVIVFETTCCDAEQIAAAEEATSRLEKMGYRLYKMERGRLTATRFPQLTMNTLAVPACVALDGTRSPPDEFKKSA